MYSGTFPSGREKQPILKEHEWFVVLYCALVLFFQVQYILVFYYIHVPFFRVSCTILSDIISFSTVLYSSTILFCVVLYFSALMHILVIFYLVSSAFWLDVGQFWLGPTIYFDIVYSGHILL